MSINRNDEDFDEDISGDIDILVERIERLEEKTKENKVYIKGIKQEMITTTHYKVLRDKINEVISAFEFENMVDTGLLEQLPDAQGFTYKNLGTIKRTDNKPKPFILKCSFPECDIKECGWDGLLEDCPNYIELNNAKDSNASTTTTHEPITTKQTNYTQEELENQRQLYLKKRGLEDLAGQKENIKIRLEKWRDGTDIEQKTETQDPITKKICSTCGTKFKETYGKFWFCECNGSIYPDKDWIQKSEVATFLREYIINGELDDLMTFIHSLEGVGGDKDV